jgi:uncharacterized phage protein gp47/JayE
MTYTAPTVNSVSGLTIPLYSDILNYYVTNAQSIFGQDIYLGIDSADYQMLSVMARIASDCMNLDQLVYNSFSAATTIGAAQDSLYKLNGLSRKAASYSTAPFTVTGTAGAVINSGIVSDGTNEWYLPTTVTFGTDGIASGTMTCAVIGPITALINTITQIVTPTYGWTSITNTAAASPGTSIEQDSAFRSRQAVSTELPSQTMLTGTVAAIAVLPNVTRYSVIENDTNVVDDNGNPPHSITAIVEGDTNADIAQAIYYNRGLGCLTNGTTSVTITDSVYGLPTVISFSRPTYVPIYVIASIHALAAYTTSTTALIQTAITNYLNSLQIGEMLTISGIYAATMTVNANISTPLFSIRGMNTGLTSSPTGTEDISVLFNEVTQGTLTNVTITLV